MNSFGKKRRHIAYGKEVIHRKGNKFESILNFKDLKKTKPKLTLSSSQIHWIKMELHVLSTQKNSCNFWVLNQRHPKLVSVHENVGPLLK